MKRAGTVAPAPAPGDQKHSPTLSDGSAEGRVDHQSHRRDQAGLVVGEKIVRPRGKIRVRRVVKVGIPASARHVLDVVIIHHDAALLRWSVAVRLNLHRDLIPFLHDARTAQVADELPLLAGGPDDGELIVNDHIHVVSVANQEPRINAASITVVGQEADLLKVSRDQAVNDRSSDVALAFVELVAGLDDVFGGKPVGDRGAAGDRLVDVLGRIERAASAKQAFHLRDKFCSPQLVHCWSKLVRQHLQRVLADSECRQLVYGVGKASVGDGGVLRGSSDPLEREMPLAAHAPVPARGHALLDRVQGIKEGRLDSGAGSSSQARVPSDDPGANHPRPQENLLLKVLGERSRCSQPRQARYITCKRSAQVAEVGHWRKGEVGGLNTTAQQ
jgi:hypothetical protein